MKRWSILILLLLPAMAAAESHVLASIPISGPNAARRLATTGISLEEGVHWTPGAIEVALSQSEARRVQDAGFSISILRADLESYYASRLRTNVRAPLTSGRMGGFYTFSETVHKLQAYRQKYRKLISAPLEIGRSLEGRPIYAVKISDNADIDEPDEPEVLYTALHHAREPESLSCVLYFMERLLQGYGKDPEITFLVNHRQLWFIPIVNPDGYVFNERTNRSGGGLWRKNRRKHADGNYGVDLNRNYGYKWGFDSLGSSPFTNDETYRGSSAFSEPETQAVRDFVFKRKFVTALHYHSYFNALLYPWSYRNATTQDRALFRDLGAFFTRFMDYVTGNAYQVLSYNANGEADDWFYSVRSRGQRMFSFTTEVGGPDDGFWPSPSRILPLAKENYESNLSLAWSAGAYPVIWKSSFARSPGDREDEIQPGGTYTLNLTVRNLGLRERLTGLSMELKSMSAAAEVQVASSELGNIDPLKSKLRSDLRVHISPQSKVNQQIPLVLWFELNGTRVRKETLTLVVTGNHL